MKALCPFALLAVFFSWATLHAGLPPELKPTAEDYDRAMKRYDAGVAARVKMDRDSYLNALTIVRKREEGAKRRDAVAAIDAEVKAVDAGLRSEKAPAHLPDEMSRYRTLYVTAPERAVEAFEGVRRFTQRDYLKWLAGMAEIARRAKRADLEAAVVEEEKRVLAQDTRRAA